MNSTQTTSHEPTQYFHTHTHTHTTNHNTDSLLTHSYHTTSICMEHSSLIFYLTIQAQRATTPTQTISVRASVSVAQPHTCTHLHTPAHTHTQSLTLQTDVDEWSTLQPTIPTMCHVSTRLSPHLHCLHIHTHTPTHTCSHKHTDTLYYNQAITHKPTQTHTYTHSLTHRLLLIPETHLKCTHN